VQDALGRKTIKLSKIVDALAREPSIIKPGRREKINIQGSFEGA